MQCHSSIWAGEAGCFREVTALHSDHHIKVPLYIACTVPCTLYFSIGTYRESYNY